MARTTIPAELVAVNAIQGTLIADNAITAVHIATNAVSGTLVADNAITSTHIAQNNVTATQIAQNTITVTQIADSAIETAKINNGAVTQAKIADDAIGPNQLAENAVVSASIANGTIVEADMADNAVTLAKMASLARGSIIVGDSAGDPSALAIGSNDYVLTSDGTDIAWEAASGGLPLSGGTLTGTLNITQASTADTIKLTRSTTAQNNMIKFASASADKWIVGQRNDSTEHFRFYSYGTSSDVLSIQTDGNVGIGTTSPSNKLHVQGSGNTAISINTGNNAGDNSTLYFGDSADSDVGFLNYDHGTNKLQFTVNASNEVLVIDSSGRVGIGTNNPSVELHVYSADQNALTVETNTAINQVHLSNSTNSPCYLTQNGYGLELKADENGWGGSNSFFAVKVKASERMRIDSSGYLLLRTTSTVYDGGQLQLTSGNDLSSMYVSNTGFASHGNMVAVERGGTSAYSFAQYYSGRRPDNGGGDREFNFRGDGNAYADASWNASGADYAEYFEWGDGNTDNNDRVGHTVSLVNNKIKIAESGETVIGVISGNPSVVGDASWNKWQGKHMRDDYGRYIWEEYTEEDGTTVDDKGNKLTRRKINPDYNSETAYINREDRKEWDIVGLMGKLRIKKGQQTGTNWIKMRDISDAVEEWLVR